MKSLLWVAWLLVSGVAIASDRDSTNALPTEASEALHSQAHVVLYSLEPWEDDDKNVPRLQGFEILGKSELTMEQAATATGAFDAAIEGWDGMRASCFDPRHAIRVVSNGHNYDFLLCYSCHQLEVFRDDRMLGSAGATGSPEELNSLLTNLHLPLSQSGLNELARTQVQQVQHQKAATQWLAAMPKSMRSYWDAIPEFRQGDMAFGQAPDGLVDALQAEIPDTRERIRALLTLYGSGDGPWTGFPGYEEIADTLLVDYPTELVAAAVQAGNASDRLLEGAARYFAGPGFQQRHENDSPLLPAPLRKRLLDHTLHSGDPNDLDRHDRAMDAFGKL